jgi:kynureninase
VTIDVPDGEAVRNELFRRQVLCDYRPGAGIRLGPHFYTSRDDVEHALAEIKSIVGGR